MFAPALLVGREDAGRVRQQPEGHKARRRIGSRSAKCQNGGGGDEEASSPTAASTPQALTTAIAHPSAAAGSKTRKEKISAVLENVRVRR